MRRLLTAVIFSTLLASSAWASVNACPSTIGAPSETLAAINANTPTGCELVDKQFSNFTAFGPSGLANIQMLNTSSPGVVGANSITGLRADFDAAGLWGLPGNTTVTDLMTYQGLVDQTFTPPTAGQWSIAQISLVLNFNPANVAQMQPGDNITILMQWCPGQTTVFSCANLRFIQAVLTNSGGTLQVAYTNSAGNSNNFLNVLSLADTTTFAVEDTLHFVGTSASSTLPLISMSNGFDEAGATPEPSTFVLFGIALAGVGALRYHRRGKTA